jgi:hypothetical protein
MGNFNGMTPGNGLWPCFLWQRTSTTCTCASHTCCPRETPSSTLWGRGADRSLCHHLLAQSTPNTPCVLPIATICTEQLHVWPSHTNRLAGVRGHMEAMQLDPAAAPWQPSKLTYAEMTGCSKAVRKCHTVDTTNAANDDVHNTLR